MPSLGCLINDPLAVAAREDPRNFSMASLITADVPVPDTFDWDLGPVLDQDGVGACVAFAATAIRSGQERIDEGSWEFDSVSAMKTYGWLKKGHGAWPGDGIPNVEGSYPQAVWKMARVEGIPGKDGTARRIAAYYQLQGTAGSADWIDTQLQVLLQYGPVSVSSAWPNNWWTCGSSGLLPWPSGNAGGHMFVKKGFLLTGPKGPASVGKSPTGRYWRYRQSWGSNYSRRDRFGRVGEFLLPFEADVAYPIFGEGGEVWKTIDIKGDDPTPEAQMVPAKDKTARMLRLAAGVQLFDISSGAPLVKMSSAATVHSPFAVSTTQYAVVITTGGVQQLARVNTADASLVATSVLT